MDLGFRKVKGKENGILVRLRFEFKFILVGVVVVVFVGILDDVFLY